MEVWVLGRLEGNFFGLSKFGLGTPYRSGELYRRDIAQFSPSACHLVLEIDYFRCCRPEINRLAHGRFA